MCVGERERISMRVMACVSVRKVSACVNEMEIVFGGGVVVVSMIEEGCVLV